MKTPECYGSFWDMKDFCLMCEHCEFCYLETTHDVTFENFESAIDRYAMLAAEEKLTSSSGDDEVRLNAVIRRASELFKDNPLWAFIVIQRYQHQTYAQIGAMIQVSKQHIQNEISRLECDYPEIGYALRLANLMPSCRRKKGKICLKLLELHNVPL